jgi:hypothetical protein
MALEVKNIKTIKNMQNFVEGCINDLEAGLSDKKETISNFRDYTFRIIELTIEKVNAKYKDKP